MFQLLNLDKYFNSILQYLSFINLKIPGYLLCS